MKHISTTTAILLAINEFGDNPFSIYNITKSIRKSVRDGAYELRYYFDDVEHDLVKDYFLELIDNGLLDHYYVRNNPNGYREYSKTIPNVIPKATIPDPTAVVQNAMATTILPKEVQLKIYTYLKGRGYSATMKQIQSRLKGHSYTCQEIKDFLDKINLIDPNSATLPTSQTWTVKI
jgi:hypothetical protein